MKTMMKKLVVMLKGLGERGGELEFVRETENGYVVRARGREVEVVKVGCVVVERGLA